MNQNQITEAGLKALGTALKHYRHKSGLSMQAVCDIAYEKMGCAFGKATISQIERGNGKPTWDTLVVLATVGFSPYTAEEMLAIACGNPVGELPDVPPIRPVKTHRKFHTAEEALPSLLGMPATERIKVAKAMLEAV